ncbi:probable 2-oxoglutarate-dependent dioxygenase AOP1 [Lycium barbarum]|uniref:probable 2-oxoglutarate-dependent dioxygenase AOP1 n=1 Tax=Lycium barbarum TaxID=112863 RepID=UPI00293E434B|nr:probable 2-oxoglutarate-dependent dioxygenase AOP1 [Lycium barbarum]
MGDSFKLPTLDFCKAELKPRTLEWYSLRDEVFKALQEYGCFEVLFDKVQPKVLHEEMKEIFNLPLELKMSISSTMFGYLGQHPTLPLYERLTIQDVLSPGVAEKFANLFLPNGKPTFWILTLFDRVSFTMRGNLTFQKLKFRKLWDLKYDF